MTQGVYRRDKDEISFFTATHERREATNEERRRGSGRPAALRFKSADDGEDRAHVLATCSFRIRRDSFALRREFTRAVFRGKLTGKSCSVLDTDSTDALLFLQRAHTPQQSGSQPTIVPLYVSARCVW